MRKFAMTLWILTSMVSTAAAIDYPVAGNILRLEDPGNPDRRIFFFRTVKQPAINISTIQDPTVAGATLEVIGAGAGDGNTGPLFLPPENWDRLNNGGYYYRDHSAANGVSQVRIKPRNTVGGSLHMSGRTPNWGYLVTQAQGDIRVRLTIGTAVYCARFTNYHTNRSGLVFGKANPAPADCN